MTNMIDVMLTKKKKKTKTKITSTETIQIVALTFIIADLQLISNWPERNEIRLALNQTPITENTQRNSGSRNTKLVWITLMWITASTKNSSVDNKLSLSRDTSYWETKDSSTRINTCYSCLITRERRHISPAGPISASLWVPHCRGNARQRERCALYTVSIRPLWAIL